MTEFEIKALELLKSIDESLKVLKDSVERQHRNEKNKRDMMNKNVRDLIDKGK
jgi:hypothetical protein